MKVVITENQIKQVLTKFFDYHFDQTEFLPSVRFEGDNWEGFFLNQSEGPRCILCRPVTGNIWFFDGQYFYNSEKMFSLSVEQFKDLMSEYIQEKYGLHVGNIM